MKQLQLIPSQSRMMPKMTGRTNPPSVPTRPTIPVTTPIFFGKSSPTYLKVEGIPQANATPRAKSRSVKGNTCRSSSPGSQKRTAANAATATASGTRKRRSARNKLAPTRVRWSSAANAAGAIIQPPNSASPKPATGNSTFEVKSSSKSKSVACWSPNEASGCHLDRTLNEKTDNSPNKPQAAAVIAVAKLREQLSKRRTNAAGNSRRETADASAATVSSTKNTIAATVPNGRRANDNGNVTNINRGPLAGASFSAKTMGNTARPARQDTIASPAIVAIATERRSISRAA